MKVHTAVRCVLRAFFVAMWQPRVRLTLQVIASPSVLALSLSGTHDQILAVVYTVAVLFVVATQDSPGLGGGCVNFISFGGQCVKFIIL